MRRERTWRSVALVAVVAAVFGAQPGAFAGGDELDGAAIMQRVDKRNRSKSEKIRVTLTVVSARGQKRIRALTIFFKAGAGNDDKILIRFDAPPEMRGTGLLTLERGDTEEQWVYLPEIRKSKRIAGSSRAGSFMGTDFNHADLRTESLEAYTYTVEGRRQVAGRPCYVVTARPRPGSTAAQSGYSRRVLFVDTERFVVHRAEYYDGKEKLLKVLTTGGWVQMEGLWRPGFLTIANQQKGSKTVAAFDNPAREINRGIEDRVFTRRYLEKP